MPGKIIFSSKKKRLSWKKDVNVNKNFFSHFIKGRKLFQSLDISERVKFLLTLGKCLATSDYLSTINSLLWLLVFIQFIHIEDGLLK